MQKTPIDRWLQKKFVYVSHIYCNTLPDTVPPEAKLEETTEETGGRYLYKFTVRDDATMNKLTAHLEVANITYASRVADGTGWANKLFNDPKKSFTMQVFWLIFIIVVASIILSGYPVKLWNELSADDNETEKGKAAVRETDSGLLFAQHNSYLAHQNRYDFPPMPRTFLD